jgi:hypothetical protein
LGWRRRWRRVGLVVGIEIEGTKRGAMVSFDLGLYVEFKRILFRNNISINEFMAFVMKLLITGDQRVHDIISEIKNQRTTRENEVSNIVHTDDESLYNIIEERLNQQKARK